MSAREDAEEKLDDLLARVEECRQRGNDLLSKGDFADACQQYDQGLLVLIRIGEVDKQRASDMRLALHLNASLAHLRRGNLASAVEHANGALADDPTNVKALYRRGMARSRLSEYAARESNVALARADLEQALELEPGNSEVRSQLHRLRAAVKAEQKELDKSQRSTFQGIFASGKELYASKPLVKASPIIRATGEQVCKTILSAEKLGFHYNRGEQILDGLDLELRAGWCVGLVGNNAAGKTTLARIILGQLSPTSGRVVRHGDKASGTPPSPPGAALATSVLAALAVGFVAILGGLALSGEQVSRLVRVSLWWHWAALITLVATLAAGIKLFLDWRQSVRSGYFVLHVTSETSDKEDISGRKTIEAVIGEVMPRQLRSDQRRACVVAMLEAGGFQMYNQATGEPLGNPAEYVRDGLQYGSLSGGQRHLIYILRCFARKPDVLLCDELLGGLDAWRQPRVLHMLNRMKKEVGVAVLYISTELHQLKLVADSIGFLADGHICELGPVEEVLEYPKHPATKEYVQIYRGLPGGRVIGGKLAENYASLDSDTSLTGEWLPM